MPDPQRGSTLIRAKGGKPRRARHFSRTILLETLHEKK
jgi:hypothetical protein